MPKQTRHFVESLRTLGSARGLAYSAMLLALTVLVSQLSIYLTPTNKLSFTILPIAMTAAFLGPVPAMLVAALGDVVTALVFPVGAYFPGYTLTALLTGLVFSLGFYQQKITLWRVALTYLAVVVIGHIGLNTLWSSLLYGKAFLPLLPARLLKSAIKYPVDVFLLWLLLSQLPRLVSLSRKPRAPGSAEDPKK